MGVIETFFYTSESGSEGVGSYTDLGLIQQSVSVSPAAPKLDIVDLPGCDGSLDRSDVLGGIRYGDRTITWVFALYPHQSWYDTQTAVSEALNGRRLWIKLSEDPDHRYRGRVAVKEYNRDRMLRQITVTAQCDPWKYSAGGEGWNATVYPFESWPTSVTFTNGAARTVPEVWIDKDIIIAWADPYTGARKYATLYAPNEGSLTRVPEEDVIKAGLEIAGSMTLTVGTRENTSGNCRIMYRRNYL